MNKYDGLGFVQLKKQAGRSQMYKWPRHVQGHWNIGIGSAKRMTFITLYIVPGLPYPEVRLPTLFLNRARLPYTASIFIFGSSKMP